MCAPTYAFIFSAAAIGAVRAGVTIAHDVAGAHKHVLLSRSSRQVRSTNQTSECLVVYGRRNTVEPIWGAEFRLIAYLGYHVRDVGVAGSNPVTPTIDFMYFFRPDDR